MAIFLLSIQTYDLEGHHVAHDSPIDVRAFFSKAYFPNLWYIKISDREFIRVRQGFIGLESSETIGFFVRHPRLSRVTIFAMRFNYSAFFERVDIQALHLLTVPTEIPFRLLAHRSPLKRLEQILIRQSAFPVHHADDYDLADDLRLGMFREFLPSLNQLSLQTPLLNDACAEALAASNILAGLEELSLLGGSITDDGALALAASPSIRNVKKIDLSNNYISPIGIEAFTRLGFEIGSQKFGDRIV